MSNIKKLLALVLALTMVLSVSAFAGYTVAPYGDAANVDEDCEVAVQLLYSLDIMKGDDKGNFNPTANITRAEIAKMIYVILNYGKDDKAVNYTGANLFSDVEKGSWYEGYVNYCASIKLIQGDGNGKFHPLENVTTAAAAKMLLTALNYVAEDRGYVGANWEQNVLADAAVLGLLDGYNYSTTGYAPRQWVAVMFYNALQCYCIDTMRPTYGLVTAATSSSYSTMGEKYYGLYKWEGVIVANEYADLEDDESLSSGYTRVLTGYNETENENIYTTFRNWSSDLTEIGESRWGWATSTKVMYVGDTGDNTVFSTGAATEIVKKYIDGIKLSDSTKYFGNFGDSKDWAGNKISEGYETENGTWLRVVDNDGDGYAEYVFVTEFEMTEVSKVAKNSTVTLKNNKSSKYFKMSEDVAVGDVVLYTKIDDNQFVELAESFEGQAEKYVYKTRTLTVDGEDYVQSDITVNDTFKALYYTDLENAHRKTDYVFYKDFFGYVRAYSEPTGSAGELVLLTDAYYETNRTGKVAAVIAYLGDELTDVDVSTSVYSDFSMFVDTTSDNNSWGHLNAYAPDKPTATTNLARYTMDDDGVMSLENATTYTYNTKGEKTGIATAYVNLNNGQEIKAGQKTYLGEYSLSSDEYDFTADIGGWNHQTGDIKVQANDETVYYYVSHYDDSVKCVTGYKNSYDVVVSEVMKSGEKTPYAVYCVASNISSDSSDAPYWVADAIVIETYYPVFNLGNSVVFGYDVNSKNVYDYADLDVINGEGELDNLSVTNYNGYNSFKRSDIEVPNFFFNTEDADGDSHIRVITADYDDYGIYAVKADRVFDLHNYVVTTTGDTFEYSEETVVYDLYGDGYITTEDDYEDALTIETGCNYIIVVDSDDTIIYAIQVESWKDAAVSLFNKICDATTDFETLAGAKTTAIASLKAEIESDNWDWTEDEIEIGVKAIENASSAENLREVAINAVKAARAAE